RHALLIRQHGLEGVEYIIEAPAVSYPFVHTFRSVLDNLQVPYIIRVHETQSGAWQHWNSGMAAEEGEVQVSPDRLRPLPLPGEARISSVPPAPAEVSESETAEPPWSENMVTFLNRDLSSADRISRRASREEALQAYANLPEPVMIRISAAIHRFLREEAANEVSPEVRDRIAELFGQIRSNPSGNKIGRNRTTVLFEIAALATGMMALPSPVAETAASDSNALNNFLRYNATGFEGRLRDHESSLNGVEDLLADNMDPEDLRPMLEEYSPDVLLDITQDSRGRGGWSLRNILSQLQGPDMDAFRDSYGPRLERLVELYETLRSSLVMRDRPSSNP
ncbi:MAG: hypothetical protein K8R69_09195, partial [Deltaproteobacteria bacterium]|nr:hypothetical protein [Deltaproteobacteria bacterium]